MIQILLCDDNAAFENALRMETRNILSKHQEDAAIHSFSGTGHLPDALLNDTDIFFLDVDFSNPEYNGIDLARFIRKHRPDSVIIFVTNYIEFAPEGYEVQAFRYLLKSDIPCKLESYLLEAIENLKNRQEMFQIRISGEIITIPIADILFFQSQAHAVMIYIQKAEKQAVRTYRFYATLIDLEEQLRDYGFLRIQKSYLVNMRRLKRYQCTEAVLDNGTVLPVSEKSYGENKKIYLRWKGGQSWNMC